MKLKSRQSKEFLFGHAVVTTATVASDVVVVVAAAVVLSSCSVIGLKEYRKGG